MFQISGHLTGAELPAKLGRRESPEAVSDFEQAKVLARHAAEAGKLGYSLIVAAKPALNVPSDDTSGE